MPPDRWVEVRYERFVEAPAEGAARLLTALALPLDQAVVDHAKADTAFEAAGDHVVLQRADDADDRLAAAGREIEHLHQPFFLELPHPFVELLVAGVLQAHAPEVLGRKPREAGNRSGAPEWSVSPIANCPGLTRPMMSPAYATSIVSRSRPKNR